MLRRLSTVLSSLFLLHLFLSLSRFPLVSHHPPCSQVHLDTDYLVAPKDLVGLAPMSVLCARLSSVLNPGVEDLDLPVLDSPSGGGAWSAGTAERIRSLFGEFVSELLQVCVHVFSSFAVVVAEANRTMRTALFGGVLACHNTLLRLSLILHQKREDTTLYRTAFPS